MQRLLIVLLFGLFCGGIMGAYAMSTLYGRDRPSEMRPAEVVASLDQSGCSPCPECKACPPPVDCEVAPPVIGPAEMGQVIGTEAHEMAEAERKPGLPISTLVGVVRALDSELNSCRSSTVAEAWSGSLVVDLVVTSTGGVAKVATVDIVETDGNSEGFGACFMDLYQTAKFEVTNQEGQGRLRQVFSVSTQ